MSVLQWPEIFERGLHLEAAEGAASLKDLAANMSRILKKTVTVDAIDKGARRYRQNTDSTLGTPMSWLPIANYTPPVTGGETDTTEAPQAPRLLELDRTKKRAAATKAELKAVLDELAITKEQLSTLIALDAATIEPRPIAVHPFAERQATAVAMASDWHVEEQVDPTTINGRNEYNMDIAEQRVERFFRGVRWLIKHHRHSFSIDRLILWLGGDLITGYIHEELEESNEASPTEAILWLLERLIGGIDSLLEDDLQLVIPCNYGNHGRTTKKRRISTGAKNSYEWLLYKFLEKHYAGNDAVEFHVAGGDHVYIDVYGRTIRFHHGDNFNYGGGVGGLSIPILRGVGRIEKFRTAYLTVIGHFHQFRDFGEVVVNGSLIGYGPYALKISAPFERAQQGFFLMDAEHGKCMVTPVWVDE